uniref:Ig-like domain-containing protein n=1 Tax=Chelydra serpentina TaxID=8475 RepID=A0A8C3T7U2_CHESE
MQRVQQHSQQLAGHTPKCQAGRVPAWSNPRPSLSREPIAVLPWGPELPWAGLVAVLPPYSCAAFRAGRPESGGCWPDTQLRRQRPTSSTADVRVAVDQWRGFPISPHFDGFSFILFLFPVKPTSPSVFPLVPCCTQTGNAPPDTSLACLVTGYFPAPVHIKWNSGQVTEEVKTFPEVTMSDGLLTQSSLLINPASSRQGNTYQCEVRHEGTAKPLTVLLPHPHPTQTPPIGGGRTKTIHHFRPKPSFVHTRTQSKPSAAQSTGSQPPGAPPAFSWLDGEVNKVLNVNVPQQGGVVASAVRTVELAVSLEGEWGSTKSDTGLCFPLSLLSVCGSTMPPQVHLLVPSCEDSSTESQLELVCLLLSFKLDKADVKWLVNGKERSPPTPAFSSAKGTDGFYMGQSRMNVTRESWEKGDIYTCQVTDPAVRKELSMRNTSKCLGEGLRP